MSDQVLRDYISFILTNADSSELLRITNDIQGLKILQVLPRLLVTDWNKWNPVVYAENKLGFYEKVPLLEKYNKKIESKYPYSTIRVFDGKKYLVKRDVTKIYELLPRNKKKLLFNSEHAVIPLLIYQNFLVIHDTKLKSIELLEKQDGKLVKLDSITHFPYRANQLTDEKFIVIRNDLSYFIYAIEDKKLSKINNGKIAEIDEVNGETLRDIKLAHSNELIILTNRRLIFSSFSSGKSEIKQIIKLLYQEHGRPLEVINQDLFAIKSTFKLKLYARTKGIWTYFQTLKNSPINGKHFDERIITLPPERKELIPKAELLPLQFASGVRESLPLELRILTLEFFF